MTAKAPQFVIARSDSDEAISPNFGIRAYSFTLYRGGFMTRHKLETPVDNLWTTIFPHA